MSFAPAEHGPPSSPPRVVAISGVIFSALYIASLIFIRLAVPADPKDPGAWLADPAQTQLGPYCVEPGSIHGDRVPLVHGCAPQPHRPPRRSVLRDNISRKRAAIRRHAVRRRRRCPGAAETFGTMPGFQSRAKPIEPVEDGILADEYFRYEDGRGLHVRDVLDWAPHRGPLTLGIVRRFRVGLVLLW